jgi:hypothetical protein
MLRGASKNSPRGSCYGNTIDLPLGRRQGKFQVGFGQVVNSHHFPHAGVVDVYQVSAVVRNIAELSGNKAALLANTLDNLVKK